MTIRNTLIEPRRELTESVVGLVVVGTVLGAMILGPYLLALHWWMPNDTYDGIHIYLGGRGNKSNWWGCLAWSAAIFYFWVVMACAAPPIIHAIGDEVCNAFQRRGVFLRPKRRYQYNTNRYEGNGLYTYLEGHLGQRETAVERYEYWAKAELAKQQVAA